MTGPSQRSGSVRMEPVLSVLRTDDPFHLRTGLSDRRLLTNQDKWKAPKTVF